MDPVREVEAGEMLDQTGQPLVQGVAEDILRASSHPIAFELLAERSRNHATSTCENCRRNRRHCDGKPVCEHCTQLRLACVYDTSRDDRGQNRSENMINELNMHRLVLDGLRYAIRTDQQGSLMAMIRQGASVEELAATIQNAPEFNPAKIDTPSAPSSSGDERQQLENEPSAVPQDEQGLAEAASEQMGPPGLLELPTDMQSEEQRNSQRVLAGPLLHRNLGLELVGKDDGPSALSPTGDQSTPESVPRSRGGKRGSSS